MSMCIKIQSLYELCGNENSTDNINLCNLVDEIHDMCKFSTRANFSLPIYLQIIFVIFLVILSGLFSGLTLGLLSLNLAELEIIINAGSNKFKKFAKRIYKVRKYGNWLLCTLLLSNVAVNAGLTVLTDKLFENNPLIGFIISATVITIFGEIFPQAVCSRHALVVGFYTAYIIKGIMFLLAPIAWPISKVLDIILGEELGTVYNNEELKQLINMHIKQDKAELEEEAGNIISGALDYTKLLVSDIMTYWKDVYKLKIKNKLTFDLLINIFKSGYSRIPCIGENNDVQGLLFVKDLIMIDPEDETPISSIISFYGRNTTFVLENDSIQKVMKTFSSGRSHLAIVKDSKSNENAGIITIEDIVEKILNFQIVDETDVYVSSREKNLVKRKPFDVAKLNVFDYRRRLPDLSLTPQEVLASYYYLTKNIDFLKPNKSLIKSEFIKKILKISNVKEIMVNNYSGSNDLRYDLDISENGLLLYREGDKSEYLTLLLDGEVEVITNKDRKEIKKSYAILGKEALSTIIDCMKRFKDKKFDVYEALPMYESNFTARITKNSRILRIKRRDFYNMLVTQTRL